MTSPVASLEIETALAAIGQIPRQLRIAPAGLEGASRGSLPLIDPGSGICFGEVPSGSATDVDQAVQAASETLKFDWRNIAPAQRCQILNKAAQLIRRDVDRLALAECLDAGKPMREARTDVLTAARYFEYYAGAADKIEGRSIPLGRDFLSFTIREPHGVTAHIVPWNYPISQVARGVAPALACGNTTVVKPAEDTPITALLLRELLDEAGLPPGCYNVVTGTGAVAGKALASHPQIGHLTFTGSVRTGQEIMRSAAANMIPVTLELGGKSPLLILSDADLDLAIDGIMSGIFTHAGQVCSASSRIIVARCRQEELIERLLVRVADVQIGHGLSDPIMGPLVSERQLARVDAMVGAAAARGVRVLTGGSKVEPSGFERGYYYAPTLLSEPPRDDPALTEEIFGPVACIQSATSDEEALSLANDSEYGLVAGVYARDIGRALRMARDLVAGQVFINKYFAGGVETPFGGVKKSGFGRQKGLAGLDEYMWLKTVTARL